MLKNKYIIIAVSALIICALFASSVFAWISFNKKLNSNNMGMTIVDVSNVSALSCYALQYDGIYGAACRLINDHDQSIEQAVPISMTEFDKIFRDRNVNTPLILRLEIANPPEGESRYISVRVPCNQKYIKNDSTASNGSNDYVVSRDGSTYEIQKCISNVCHLKVGCELNVSDLSLVTPTATTTERKPNNVNIFNSQIEAFSTITTGYRVAQFATATKSNGNYIEYSKESTIEVKLYYSDYSDGIFEVEGSDEKHLILYIFFDYSDELMDAFIAHLPESEEGNTVFENDLEIIEVKEGED